MDMIPYLSPFILASLGAGGHRKKILLRVTIFSGPK